MGAVRPAGELRPGRLHSERRLRGAGRRLGAIESARVHSDGRLFYLAIPPSLRQDDRPPGAERCGGPGRPSLYPAVGAGDHREAVRPRPGEREGAQPHRPEGVRGAPGLPHRPLPRQGDGAEPAGVPLRQLDLRAGVEPPSHRSRADHRGGDASASSIAAGYYEEAGVLRDMFQNHLLQLLALTAMEPPVTFRPTRCATRRSRCCAPSGRFTAAEMHATRCAGSTGRAPIDGEAGAGLPAGAGRRAGLGHADLRRAPAS